MSNYKIIKSDELYHHGILGQKWGTRNGPPYPLDASDHSASEKKAGWRKSLGSSVTTRVDAIKRRRERDSAIQETYNKAERSIEKNYKRGQNLSDIDSAKLEKADLKARSDWKASKEQFKKDVALTDEEKAKLKTAVKIGAAAAVTGLAAYGVYKVTKLGENAIHKKGQNAVLKMENAKAKWISDVVSTTNKLSDTTGGYIYDHFDFRTKDGSLDRLSTKYANTILGEYNQDIANLKAQARYRDKTARTSEKMSIGANIIKDRVRNAGKKLTAKQKRKTSK